MQHAYRVNRDAILRADLAREMLTPRFPAAPVPDRYGLGFQVAGAPGRTTVFWHAGGTAGFDAYFAGYVETGQGVAILVNGKNSGELVQALVDSIRKDYGWPR